MQSDYAANKEPKACKQIFGKLKRHSPGGCIVPQRVRGYSFGNAALLGGVAAGLRERNRCNGPLRQEGNKYPGGGRPPENARP